MVKGKNIEKRRKQLGYSIDDVAAGIGKDRTTVYRYENGSTTNIPSNTIQKLAEFLQTTVENLTTDIDNVLVNPESAEIVSELLDDNDLYNYVNKLISLPTEKRESIYDMIDFQIEKMRH